MLNIFYPKQTSTEVDISYENFKFFPNNLTSTECKELGNMILKSFLEPLIDDEENGGYCNIQPEGKGEPIWIIDFMLYINTFIMISFLLMLFIFSKPAHDEPDDEELAVNQEEETAEDDASMEANLGSNEDGQKEELGIEEVSEETDDQDLLKEISKKDDHEDKEVMDVPRGVTDRPKPYFNLVDFDDSEGLIENTPDDVMIKKSNESLNEEQQDQPIASMFDSYLDPCVISYANLSRSNKPMPNFIQKNIEKVIQKSEFLHANSSRLTLSPISKAKDRKSLIPVRTTTANKSQHDESSC